MSHFSAAAYFSWAIQIFCALAGGLTAYLVTDILEPMVMTALLRPRLTFPRAQLVRLGAFGAFALLVFFLVGEVGPGGGSGWTTRGVEGTEGAKGSAPVKGRETLAAPSAQRDFRVRVLAPETAAKHIRSNGDTRKLFLVWEGAGTDPDLLDFHEARERVAAWKKTAPASGEPRISLVYTNDDPDDTAPIVVGFSRFLRDGGIGLDRRTASDSESAIPVKPAP